MKCDKCGNAVSQIDNTGGTNPGDEFTETYECANGHLGHISGTVGNSPDKWTKTGAIFQ